MIPALTAFALPAGHSVRTASAGPPVRDGRDGAAQTLGPFGPRTVTVSFREAPVRRPSGMLCEGETAFLPFNEAQG
jgi:hypothetical protein